MWNKTFKVYNDLLSIVNNIYCLVRDKVHIPVGHKVIARSFLGPTPKKLYILMYDAHF